MGDTLQLEATANDSSGDHRNLYYLTICVSLIAFPYGHWKEDRSCHAVAVSQIVQVAKLNKTRETHHNISLSNPTVAKLSLISTHSVLHRFIWHCCNSVQLISVIFHVGRETHFYFSGLPLIWWELVMCSDCKCSFWQTVIAGKGAIPGIPTLAFGNNMTSLNWYLNGHKFDIS